MNKLTPWAYFEIPGDIGLRIKKVRGETIALFGLQRGDWALTCGMGRASTGRPSTCQPQLVGDLK